MRKKQLLAFLTVGALSVSMVSTAAFAAAENGSEAPAQEEVILEEAAPEESTGDVPVEVPEDVPVDVPEEITSDITEDAPEEKETETTTPEETPVETTTGGTVAVASTQSETDPEEKNTPEFTITVNGQGYATLAEAIAAAPDSTEEQGETTQILVTGIIEIQESVNVTAGKNITIVAAAEDTEISRAAEFKGDLFVVDGGTLHFSGGKTEGTDSEQTAVGTLSVDGSLESGEYAEGSIVKVKSGYLGLSEGASLVNNMTTTNGGAVNNVAGTVILMGGSINGNEAAEGGAIYSEGSVAVQGSGIFVNENTKTSTQEENNIALNGENAVLTITGALTDSVLGVTVVDVADGKAVVQLAESAVAEGVTMAEVLEQIYYDGDESFEIDEDGNLAEIGADPTATPTASPTKAPTGTPSPTKKPTPTPAPLRVKAVSAKWLKYNSIRLVVNANRSGTYYVSWVPAGSAAPTIDTTKKDGDVVADYDFTATVTNLPAEAVDIYVCVVDTAGNYSATVFKTADIGGRPAAPTDAPTPTPDHVPVVPAVTESVVRGLEKPLEFYPNTFYEFTVIGAGTQNTNPGIGDVRWIPQYWSMSSNPPASDRHTPWKIGAETGIRDAKTYNIYVFFQKQVFNGTQWQATDVIESVAYQFQSAAITIVSGTPTPSIEGQYGESGTGGTGDDLSGTPAADNSTDAAGTGRSAVATADESPVGSMMMLAAASLLAGGYVLVRRRKKEM